LVVRWLLVALLGLRALVASPERQARLVLELPGARPALLGLLALLARRVPVRCQVPLVRLGSCRDVEAWGVRRAFRAYRRRGRWACRPRRPVRRRRLDRTWRESWGGDRRRHKRAGRG